MRILNAFFSALVFVAAAQPATAADQRPTLKGISAVRIANYGAPSKLIQERAEVRAIVEDLGDLRKRQWTRVDHTTMRCYSTVVLMSGRKPVATFRVKANQVVEIQQLDKSRQAASGVDIGEVELLYLKKLLSEIAPAKGCD